MGHVGDGNFHQIVMYDPGKPEQQKAVGDCVNAMMIDALEMEGTVSVRLDTHPLSSSTHMVWLQLTFTTTLQGEHGIGLGKKVSASHLFLPPTSVVERLTRRARNV